MAQLHGVDTVTHRDVIPNEHDGMFLLDDSLQVAADSRAMVSEQMNMSDGNAAWLQQQPREFLVDWIHFLCGVVSHPSSGTSTGGGTGNAL